ncbi:E3 ubiquitin-protein ligase AIP2-like [Rutidosis leptorrhynchoides]|uniref:E3 ubiquitin-protein ligase AIP2-like n=1 Tax=Rutidosis leptorrhynchoides TaxID=125765 RepID=UPI003A997CBA
MEREDELNQKLQELQKQLGKKQMFEEAVSSIRSLLHQFYPSASPSLRKSFFTVISRVATILKTRYTSPGFWSAGLGLFLEAEQLVSESSEKQHLKTCIIRAQEQLSEIENQPEESAQNGRNQGYLFEGHLTVDQEPPPPQWLVQSNMMSALAATMSQNSTSDGSNNLPQELLDRIHDLMPNVSDESNNLPQEMIDRLVAMFPEGDSAPKAPPASKEVVAKLPIITITDEILAKLGPDAECAICKENLVVNDSMQEMPCKHTFHPPCLKPWLDEHNSCPICRHELRTDDHEYESRKEREKEAEEERKGAANAVREGEYMYV